MRRKRRDAWDELSRDDRELIQALCLAEMLHARKLEFRIFPDGTVAFSAQHIGHVSQEVLSSIENLRDAFSRFNSIARDVKTVIGGCA